MVSRRIQSIPHAPHTDPPYVSVLAEQPQAKGPGKAARRTGCGELSHRRYLDPDMGPGSGFSGADPLSPLKTEQGEGVCET